MNKLFFFIIIVLSAVSCNVSQQDKPVAKNDSTETSFNSEVTKVKVCDVLFGNFDTEVISNGKVFAINNADINFPFNEKIETINVENGKYIHKGEVLATLNGKDFMKRLARAKETLNKAMIDLDDRLIDYGYRLKDSITIPKDIMRMAK